MTALLQKMCLQCQINVPIQFAALWTEQIINAEIALGILNPRLGQPDCLILEIQPILLTIAQRPDKQIGLLIKV